MGCNEPQGDDTCEFADNETNRTENEGGNNVNISTIKKSNMSEFAEQLAWDVDLENDTSVGELNTRIVSPRISALLLGEEVTVLVNSGSDVTCVSERYYGEIKARNEKESFNELPVSNITVCVAVGTKATVIKEQVQLVWTIDKMAFEFPFLIVPNLLTDVLVGMDWLEHFRVVIDIEKKRIKVFGNYLPQQIVTFRASSVEKAFVA